MNSPKPDDRGWYSIAGEPTAAALRPLRSLQHIDQLSITKSRRITVRHAKALRALAPIKWLWLWCKVTRTAMQHIIQIPGLEELDVLNITAPGSLSGFESAASLHTFRTRFLLKEIDVLAIAKCAMLQELGIQGTELTPKAVAALLSLNQLHSLNVEASNFDDAIAQRLSTSSVLENLDVGATQLTRVGLKHLVSMQQLRSLDLWATALVEDDLELLAELPNLEYLSVGNYAHLPAPDAARLVPLLLSLPALKQVWLDGVKVTAEQEAALALRLESVHIT